MVHIRHTINWPECYIERDPYTGIEYLWLYKLALLSESCITFCEFSTPFRVKTQTQSQICNHDQSKYKEYNLSVHLITSQIGYGGSQLN